MKTEKSRQTSGSSFFKEHNTDLGDNTPGTDAFKKKQAITDSQYVNMKDLFISHLKSIIQRILKSIEKQKERDNERELYAAETMQHYYQQFNEYQNSLIQQIQNNNLLEEIRHSLLQALAALRDHLEKSISQLLNLKSQLTEAITAIVDREELLNEKIINQIKQQVLRLPLSAQIQDQLVNYLEATLFSRFRNGEISASRLNAVMHKLITEFPNTEQFQSNNPTLDFKRLRDLLIKELPQLTDQDLEAMISESSRLADLKATLIQKREVVEEAISQCHQKLNATENLVSSTSIMHTPEQTENNLSEYAALNKNETISTESISDDTFLAELKALSSNNTPTVIPIIPPPAPSEATKAPESTEPPRASHNPRRGHG